MMTEESLSLSLSLSLFMCVRLYESIEVAFNFALLAGLLVGGGKGGR